MNATILEWLERLAASETPGTDIVAYNIGIFETERGYCAYLTGARHFDPDDDDWAVAAEFAPAERFLVLDRQPLQWQQVLALFVAALRQFLTQAIGRSSFLGRAAAVTVGFDGGDLVRVA